MIDFNTFIKIAQECGRFGQINFCQRLSSPKSNKSHNLVTLFIFHLAGVHAEEGLLGHFVNKRVW